MGTVRSATDHSGTCINGVLLGQPIRDIDGKGNPSGEYRWDDSRLPDGYLVDGTLTITKGDL